MSEQDRAAEIAVDDVQAEIIRAAIKESWRKGWEAASAALGRPDINPAAMEGFVQKGLVAAAYEKGRREGLEEAAKVCERPISGIGHNDPRTWASPEHAFAIRALADKVPA